MEPNLFELHLNEYLTAILWYSEKNNARYYEYLRDQCTEEALTKLQHCYTNSVADTTACIELMESTYEKLEPYLHEKSSQKVHSNKKEPVAVAMKHLQEDMGLYNLQATADIVHDQTLIENHIKNIERLKVIHELLQ